jgi:hypothetical protein
MVAIKPCQPTPSIIDICIEDDDHNITIHIFALGSIAHYSLAMIQTWTYSYGIMF